MLPEIGIHPPGLYQQPCPFRFRQFLRAGFRPAACLMRGIWRSQPHRRRQNTKCRAQNAVIRRRKHQRSRRTARPHPAVRGAQSVPPPLSLRGGRPIEQPAVRHGHTPQRRCRGVQPHPRAVRQQSKFKHTAAEGGAQRRHNTACIAFPTAAGAQAAQQNRRRHAEKRRGDKRQAAAVPRSGKKRRQHGGRRQAPAQIVQYAPFCQPV